MNRVKKYMFTCLLLICSFCVSALPVKADTDGTELNVLEPSKLEIQLGQDWSGVQFQLKTDVGLYPEEISVGEDGVLRLEIGGSSTYILTCLNSELAAPSPDLIDNPSFSEDSDGTEMTSSESETADERVVEDEREDAASANGNTGTVAGIPIAHLLLFCVGFLTSVGTLIAIRVISNKKKDVYEYDDDEEDE